MEALVGGDMDTMRFITEFMEQNGFAVTEIFEGSICIRFKCFTEESLCNLKRLYTDKTLDVWFTETFCAEFAEEGLDALSLHIEDNEFNECFETFRLDAVTGGSAVSGSIQLCDFDPYLLLQPGL